jgi:hypothetical protein
MEIITLQVYTSEEIEQAAVPFLINNAVSPAVPRAPEDQL